MGIVVYVVKPITFCNTVNGGRFICHNQVSTTNGHFFNIYIFDTNEEIHRMGILKNKMSTQDGCFFFDVVRFLIFEMPTLFSFRFYYDIWYVLGWYQCWAVLTFSVRTFMIFNLILRMRIEGFHIR
jgi:hypothetical protein